MITAAYENAPSDETRDGYRVVRLPAWTPPPSRVGMNYEIPWTFSPRNLRRLFRILDDFRPDVVHQGGQFFDLTWMSAIWARRRKVPTVMTVYTALVHSDRIARALLWLGDMVLVRPFIAIGRPTIVVIDAWIDSYSRRRYRVGDDRIATVMIGIDADRFIGVDGREVRERLGLVDRPVVLSLGHVIPLIRDRLALVHAMPYLLERQPDLVVLVVGHVFDDTFLAARRRARRPRPCHLHRRGREGRSSLVRRRVRRRSTRLPLLRARHDDARGDGGRRAGRVGGAYRQLPRPRAPLGREHHDRARGRSQGARGRDPATASKTASWRATSARASADSSSTTSRSRPSPATTSRCTSA